MKKELTGSSAAKTLRLAIEKDAAMLKKRGITPALAVLRIGEKEDDKAYENSLIRSCEKVGVAVKRILLPREGTTDDAVQAIMALNKDGFVHGVLMMRPLPKQLNERVIVEALEEGKDVDGMTSKSLAKVFMGDRDGFAPCTAQAVAYLLRHEGVEIEGREVVILGRSLVVGKPLSMLLLGENATVTVCHTRTRKLKEVCKRADILIACAGRRHLVDQSFVKEGAVLVDVGIHADESGTLAGDIHPSAYEKALMYTPVPGGVGSVTSWILIDHVVCAARRAGGLV